MASLSSWGGVKKAKADELEFDVFLSWDRVEKHKTRVRALAKALGRTHKIAPLNEGWDPVASLDSIRKSSAVIILVTQEYIAAVSDWTSVKETGNRWASHTRSHCPQPPLSTLRRTIPTKTHPKSKSINREPPNRKPLGRCRLEFAACMGVQTPQFSIPVQLDVNLTPEQSRGTVGQMLADRSLPIVPAL